MDLPLYLKNKLNEEYRNDEIEKIILGYNCFRKTTFRVNTLISSNEEILKILDENNIKYQSISWYDNAFILESDYDIRKLPIYEEGKIYIQSLSSMLPPLILEPKEGESILDMTSAPGSKTTMLSCLSSGKARIMAVEKDKIRCDRLKYNINKQKSIGITVINQDASLLDDYFKFDKILLDAPCSGSGTLNKSNIKYFSEKLVNNSVNTQIKLLKKALNLLKVGGELVYSTCSILKEENEYVLKEVLKNNNIIIEKINISDIPLLHTLIDGTICLYPNELYEGFFVSKIRKIKE